jgi:signal transduction histidine kinase
VSLPILITPRWYRTNVFRAFGVGLFLALLWGAYQVRMRQVQRAFEMTLDARVGERTRIARELPDTLLQSFHGPLLRFQTVSYLLPARPAEAKQQLDGAIVQAAKAITEGRDTVQGLRRRPSNATTSLRRSGPLATTSRATWAPITRPHWLSPSKGRRGICA